MTRGLQESRGMPVVAAPVVAADGSYTLLDLQLPAGTEVPPLAHAGTAALAVVAGELELVCGEHRRRLGPGRPATIAAHEPCRISVLQDAHVLCLAVPAGLDALVDLLTPEGPGDADDLAARLAAAGVTLLPAGWGAAR